MMELHQCLYAYLEELQNGRRVSASTYDAYRRDLEHAMSYLEGQGLSPIGSVQKHHLLRYLQLSREEGDREFHRPAPLGPRPAPSIGF